MSAVDLGEPELPSETLDIDDGEAIDLDIRQRLLDRLELVGLNDRDDQFHDRLSTPEKKSRFWRRDEPVTQVQTPRGKPSSVGERLGHVLVATRSCLLETRTAQVSIGIGDMLDAFPEPNDRCRAEFQRPQTGRLCPGTRLRCPRK